MRVRDDGVAMVKIAQEPRGGISRVRKERVDTVDVVVCHVRRGIGFGSEASVSENSSTITCPFDRMRRKRSIFLAALTPQSRVQLRTCSVGTV